MNDLVAVPINEIVQCSDDRCGIDIARVVKVIYKDSVLRPEYFDWFVSPISFGDEPFCDKCGKYFAYNGRLHIKNKGWVKI